MRRQPSVPFANVACVVVDVSESIGAPVVVEAWYWPGKQGGCGPLRFHLTLDPADVQFGDVLERDSERYMRWYTPEMGGAYRLVRLRGDVIAGALAP